MDRTKVLHGPWTRTYGETNYLRDQVLDRTKVLHGPRTQTHGETNYLRIMLGYSDLHKDHILKVRLSSRHNEDPDLSSEPQL